MTQSPYGSPDDALDQDATPARAADWSDPAGSYQASSGFVASTDLPATGATYGEPGYAASTDRPQGTAGVAKEQAADLKDTAKERGQQVAGTAKEQAGQVKDTALEQGQQVAGVAKEQAVQVKDEALSQARDLIAQSRTELSSQAAAQQQRLATIVHGFADELGSMASSTDKSGPLTDLAQTGARRGGEIAHWLQESEPSDLLEQVRSFARRRPVAFLAGSVLAGVVVGRLTRNLVADARSDDQDDVTASYGAGTTGYASDSTVSYGAGYTGAPAYSAEPGYTSGTGYETGAPVYGSTTPAETYGTPDQGGYAR